MSESTVRTNQEYPDAFTYLRLHRWNCSPETLGSRLQSPQTTTFGTLRRRPLHNYQERQTTWLQDPPELNLHGCTIHKGRERRTHRRSCVKLLYKRVKTYCRTQEVQKEKLRYLMWKFSLSGYPSSFIQDSSTGQQAVVLHDRAYSKQFPISLTSQKQSPICSNHAESELPIVRQESCAADWWESKIESTRVSSPRSSTGPSARAVSVNTQDRPQRSSPQWLRSTNQL